MESVNPKLSVLFELLTKKIYTTTRFGKFPEAGT